MCDWVRVMTSEWTCNIRAVASFFGLNLRPHYSDLGVSLHLRQKVCSPSGGGTWAYLWNFRFQRTQENKRCNAAWRINNNTNRHWLSSLGLQIRNSSENTNQQKDRKISRIFIENNKSYLLIYNATCYCKLNTELPCITKIVCLGFLLFLHLKLQVPLQYNN